MELYWKVIGAVLVSVILGLNVGKQQKEFFLLLTVTVCCMGAAAIMQLLNPVLELLRELEQTAQLKDGLMSVLLKCTGISLVTELACLICRDSGSASLEKMLHMLGSTVILYLSVPMISSLLTLIRQILGDL